LLKRAIQEPTYLPILAHVLLQVKEGRARLSANNLEFGITCDLATSSADEGAIAVPWGRLQDLVGHLPPSAPRGQVGDASIEMESAGDASTLTLHSGCSRAAIYGMHASEFPVVHGPGSDGACDGLTLSLASDLLAALLHKVAFAVSTDERRNPILCGVLLHARGQSLTISGRDAYRLAACACQMQEAVPRECAAVIPTGVAVACAHVLASFRPTTTPVQLVIEEQHQQMAFFLPGLRLSSRLLVGTYPLGFEKHMTPSYLTRIEVETRGLASALKPLAQVARADSDLVTLTVDAATDRGKGVLSVGAQSRDLGEQVEAVDVMCLEGEAGAPLLLKYSQLTEIMAVLDAPALALEMRERADPIAVRPVGGDERVQETYLLVPCTRKA